MHARKDVFFNKQMLEVISIASNEWIIDCKNEDKIVLECSQEEFKAYQILNLDNPKENLEMRVSWGSYKYNMILPLHNKIKVVVNTLNINKLGVIGHEEFNQQHEVLGNVDGFEYQNDNKVLVRGWIGDSFYTIKDIYLQFTNENGKCVFEKSVTHRYRIDLVETLKDTKYLYSGFINVIEYLSGSDIEVHAICYTPDKTNSIELGILRKNVDDVNVCDINIIDSKKYSVEDKYLQIWNTPSVLECYDFIDELSSNLILYINHSFGGGADLYLRKKADEFIKNGHEVYQVIYQPDFHQYELINMKDDEHYYFDDINILLYLVSMKAKHIYFNELVSYPNIKGLIDIVQKIKSIHPHIQFTYLVHDYFCICPRLNLINVNDRYCGLPEVKDCDICLKRANFDQSKSIVEWRSLNAKLLNTCDEIICFSNSSKKYLVRVYQNLSDKIKVIGHVIDELRAPKVKNDNIITIGLLGQLCKHKGIEKIKELIQYIHNNQLSKYRIVCIGDAQDMLNDSVFFATGKYRREDIVNLVEEYNIDVFFMSSVCPETFSYTISEIQSMKRPLISYDLGAQGERTKNYKLGKVIPLNTKPELLLRAINDLCEGDILNE
jgi:glycosyltransferase involved in cell wall biosynthesis